jgi:hypothetical protein
MGILLKAVIDAGRGAAFRLQEWGIELRHRLVSAPSASLVVLQPEGCACAPARALTWRGESPRQAEDSPACDRRLLRRGDTGWGAAGGELPVRNIDSVYSRNTVNSIRPDGETSLRVLSEVRAAAQAFQAGRGSALGGAGQRDRVRVLKESVNRRKAATSPEGGWRQNGRKRKRGKQGDLPGTEGRSWPQRPEEPPGRSQSIRSSQEAG